ncbi:hypothetical protein [Nannocystis radixulma]|uniref:Uncharacterized protein n=1 Tax=Nannocystis radixulma TaxID=2995305 RepID=A0ABT5B2M9_9BACT|nr:hypothetical protein [Nannocystis radixulma]MDC0667799.1 hypothetical protein [Nannocystis radixulma]
MRRTISISWGAAALVLALACDSGGGGMGTDQPPEKIDDGSDDPPSTEGFTDGTPPPQPVPDVGPGPAFECDPWQQDCPEGQKCNLYSLDGDKELDGAKCVPLVDPAQQQGELCFAEDGYGSGLDDCDAGLVCWDVAPSGAGHCVKMCDSGAGTATCPEGQLCTQGFGDFNSMCLSPCNPLEQYCIEGELCASGSAGYVCAPDASGVEGQIYDTCKAANACDRGLMCAPPEAAPGCTAGPTEGCCLPFCEVGGVCPDGLECIGLHDPEQQPGLDAIGMCATPP